MKQIVCEMCEGTKFMKEDGAFICQGCGMKYSAEEAKKMMVEVEGVVAQEEPQSGNKGMSDELKNLYEVARRARNDNNSEYAQKYYDQIVMKDPSSWEANFYTVYYQSMNCKIAGIQSAAIHLSNCEDTVLKLVKENVPQEEHFAVLDEIAAKLINISSMLFNAAKNHYDGIGYQIRNNYTQEYLNNCCAARDIVYNFGNYVITMFGDNYGKKIAVPCWKVGIQQHNILLPRFAQKETNQNIIQQYANKIKKYDPTYVAPAAPAGTSGGCYVATAVYGSYDCPQVWTLRRYRDNTLAATWYGRLFIRTYYAVSPTLVKWFGKTNWFKKMWQGKLDRMVSKLQAQGVESTPYDDRIW